MTELEIQIAIVQLTNQLLALERYRNTMPMIQRVDAPCDRKDLNRQIRMTEDLITQLKKLLNNS